MTRRTWIRICQSDLCLSQSERPPSSEAHFETARPPIRRQPWREVKHSPSRRSGGTQISSAPSGLPQFHRITFRIMYPCEASHLRIPFGAGFNLDAVCRQLRDKSIEIIHPEIDHPLLFSTTEVFAISVERPKNRHSGLLMPHGFMQIVDAEMFFIPFGQTGSICCPEEYATNSNGSGQDFLPLLDNGKHAAQSLPKYQAERQS